MPSRRPIWFRLYLCHDLWRSAREPEFERGILGRDFIAIRYTSRWSSQILEFSAGDYRSQRSYCCVGNQVAGSSFGGEHCSLSISFAPISTPLAPAGIDRPSSLPPIAFVFLNRLPDLEIGCVGILWYVCSNILAVGARLSLLVEWGAPSLRGRVLFSQRTPSQKRSEKDILKISPKALTSHVAYTIDAIRHFSTDEVLTSLKGPSSSQATFYYDEVFQSYRRVAVRTTRLRISRLENAPWMKVSCCLLACGNEVNAPGLWVVVATIS